MLNQPCPCGSKKTYLECCYPFISGSNEAPDPEALMRSRYTAFFLNDIPYLQKSWHPETMPDDLDKEEPGNWIGLEILEVDFDEEEGEVEFKAKFIYDGKLEILHEKSQFEKIDNKWVYHSGEFINDGHHITKIKKSDPCPCGSGKLFKNCHLNK